MIRPLSGIGKGVSTVVRGIGWAFLSVGKVLDRVVHLIGGAVRG
jgi:uncharacterized alpha-E superfamily protein